MNDEELSEDEIERILEIDSRIVDEVMPILDEIEEQYPEDSAYFGMLINTIHVLFSQGWTKEELISEIENHHKIYHDHEVEDSGGLH